MKVLGTGSRPAATDSGAHVKEPAATDAPRADRPVFPDGYGVPETDEGLLPWSQVVDRLNHAKNYWVCTVDTRGRPHSTPVWGGVVEERLYFEGSAQTLRGRNLAANPAVSIHLESGTEVVIVEGAAREMTPSEELADRLALSLSEKYASLGYQPSREQWASGGLYAVEPRVVFAWSRFPADVTRFRFE